MPKNVLRGLSIVLGVLFLCGCAATKDVEMRHYIEVKDRVDQSMDQGNAGFLSGTPQPEDRSDIRKTRKTYVWEFSKSTDEGTEGAVVDDGAVAEEPVYEDYEEDFGYEEDMGVDSERSMDRQTEAAGYDDIYVLDDAEKPAPPAPSVVEYTVEKDDTLQKISKKFYDSYSKWPKIYDANKAVIDDPDRIKPGIKLQIPME